MMGLYVLGEDENDAHILELENVNRITGKLTISGIGNGMDPDVAHKECLKKKENLQKLTLIFRRNVGVSENQLEGLEPPPGIRNLKIVQYPGQESMRWMLKNRGAEVAVFPRFRSLSKLELSDFPNLERLEGLTELPCLEKLVLKEMTALKSISGGPFPSLSELSVDEMPSLGVVWMATEVSLADVEGGHMQIGNCLSVLSISECPKLMVMPYFPSSLKSLRLDTSNVQLLGQPGIGQGSSLLSFSFSFLKKLYLDDIPPPAGAASYGSGCQWELLQHLTALESLDIYNCDGLTELPESMRSLASLQTLRIAYCDNLCMLPNWLGELCYLETMDLWGCISLSIAPSMQPLKALKALHITYSVWEGGLCPPSLQTLQIDFCDSISSLPQCLGGLRSLQILGITELTKLSSLPESLGYLTSLEELQITDCVALGQLPDCVGELRSLRVFKIWGLQSLTCLPQSLGRLTSLQELEIGRCEALGQLPESLGELRSLRLFKIQKLWSLTCLPQSLGCLTSLQELKIGGCEALGQLPDCVGDLCSLRGFNISMLPSLTSGPESMCCLTSLEHIMMWDCPGIKSLPEWIKGLTALQTLEISFCPDLERRCERRKGKDWHLISHIPHLKIGYHKGGVRLRLQGFQPIR